MIAISEAVNYTAIPNFVPFGVLWYAEDTGDLWIGTGSSEPPKVSQVASAGGSPGGFNGDLQYNNNGSLGGSAATTDAEGDITVPGFLSVASTLFDQTGSAGRTGQFLQTTVNGVLWATTSGSGGSPGGSSGDIQFNSGSSFGGSTATITSTGSITIPVNSDLFWGNDTQISRISGGALSIGVGAHGDETGSLILNNIHLGAGLYDGTGNIGSNNNLLSSTGSGIAWTSTPSVASISSTTATIANAFITTATITTATISGNGYVSTLVSPSATITTLTVSGNELITGTETLGLTSYTAAITNSPQLVIAGSYQSATSTFLEDSWTIQDVIGSGTNGTSTLTFTHSGSSGAASVSVPLLTCSAFNVASGNMTFANAGTIYFEFHNGTSFYGGSATAIGFSSNTNPTAATPDTAISRVSAGILGIGTGAQGNTAGSLQLSKLLGPAANSDITGTVSGATTTAAKAYAVNYTAAPVVVVTPTTVCSTFYVSSSTAGGYVVNYGPSQAAIFNYCVIGNPS